MFNSQPLDAGEAVALGASRLDVKVLKSALVTQQLLVRLPVNQSWLTQLADAASFQRLLYLGIGAERVCPITQRQIQLHIGKRRLPNAVNVLGPQRLVIKVPRPVVRRSPAGCP